MPSEPSRSDSETRPSSGVTGSNRHALAYGAAGDRPRERHRRPAGAGFLRVLAELPEANLARLESGAARSGSPVVAVAGGAQRALAHTSLTLELERMA